MEVPIETVLEKFRTNVKRWTFQTYAGKTYVLVTKLKEWLKSTEPQTNRPWIGLLLYAAYRKDGRQGSLPIESENLYSDENASSLLVFSILLELGCGHLIHSFSWQSIHDRDLGRDLNWLIGKFKEMDISEYDKLAWDFDRLQWQYCPVKLERGLSKYFQERMVMPICRRELINDKGGNAQVWQIEVQEEFVSQSLRKIVDNSRNPYNNIEDNYGTRYQFALKSFSPKNTNAFMDEKRAFDSLRNHDGVIKYLCDYEQRESDVSRYQNRCPDGSCLFSNILLEFGEADLDEFFHDRLPPVLQTEVEGFWKDMFDLAESVEKIHNLKTETEGFKEEFLGWHADIKPDNILLVDTRFKLADPGFAAFVPKSQSSSVISFKGGTETYGAPESFKYLPGDILTQAIDIWSLGCVFSVAATWVVLGYEGIRQFMAVRQKSKQSFGGSSPVASDTQLLTRGDPVGAGDSFHDGKQILECVSEWHQYLLTAIRKSDSITPLVISLAENSMLCSDAAKRISAKDLVVKLKEVLETSSHGDRYPVPNHIGHMLQELDQEVLVPTQSWHIVDRSDQVSQSVQTSDNSHIRKSWHGRPPSIRTTHRSTYRSSEFDSRTVPRITENSLVSPSFETSSSSNILNHISAETYALPRSTPQSIAADVIIPLSPSKIPFGEVLADTSSRSRSRNARLPRNQLVFDMFQAREYLDKSRSRRFKANSLLRKNARNKDRTLSKYYGDRDVVFLIDNATTMEPFWYQAKFLLEVLVEMLVGQDEDGMDMFFTLGQHKVHGRKDSSGFISAMNREDVRPIFQAQSHGPPIETDIAKPLGDFFYTFLKENKKNFTKQRKTTLIVLTDGIWAATPDGGKEVYNVITRFVKEATEACDSHIDSPISIQFIQFGDNPEATRRLRHLEKDPKYDGIPDVIDCEPSYGDVYKMLLGSFNEIFDRDAEDSSSEPPYPVENTGPPLPIFHDRSVSASPSPEITNSFPGSISRRQSWAPHETYFPSYLHGKEQSKTRYLSRE